MSVPLHWTADGLPVGLLFSGRFGDEAMAVTQEDPQHRVAHGDEPERCGAVQVCDEIPRGEGLVDDDPFVDVAAEGDGSLVLRRHAQREGVAGAVAANLFDEAVEPFDELVALAIVGAIGKPLRRDVDQAASGREVGRVERRPRRRVHALPFWWSLPGQGPACKVSGGRRSLCARRGLQHGDDLRL